MELIINDQTVNMIDIKHFRQTHQLPDHFSIRLFDAKDFDGLGRVDEGGTELNELRHTILDAIPQKIALPELLGFVGNLSQLFRVKLYEINDRIGLRPVEIDFAAAGFEDVCQSYAYDIVRHKTQNTDLDFKRTYTDWLNGTVRISTTTQVYETNESTWRIYIMNTAYGRIGLKIITDDATYYVRDGAYSCPAEGFMLILLRDVCNALQSAVN